MAQNEKSSKSKGKVFRGAAYSSLYKNTYASIPSQKENFLLSNVHDKLLDGFISHSERFNSSATATPGIGTYNLSSKPVITSYNTSMSSKGYCNGFISSTSRLDSKQYINTNPGPGSYKDEKFSSISNNIKNSLHCKSLYKVHNNHSLIEKETETPGPSRYDPLKYDNWKLRNKNYIYSFDSYPKREGVVEKYKLVLPGPGYYYKENGKKNIRGLAWIENKECESEIEKLNSLGIETEGNAKIEMNKGDRGKVFKNGDMCIMIHKNSTQGNAIIYRKRGDGEKKKMKEGNIQNIRFKIEEEKELNYLKQFLGNDNAKPDLFYLNSPRWKKESKSKYKAPGPAYYIPKNPKDRYSYNKNNSDFICPGGIEFE